MWLYNFDGIYSMSSGCRIINSMEKGSIQIPVADWSSFMLLKTCIPPRIHIFCWRLFLYKLPIRDLLLTR